MVDGGFAESCPEWVDVDVEVPVAEEPAGGVVADFAAVWVDAGGFGDLAGSFAAGFDGLAAEFLQVGSGVFGGLFAGGAGDGFGDGGVHR